MNDQEILDRAERAARSLVGPDDAYEALLRRRDRKRRNQRIAAGVVGVALFVAAIWIVTSEGWFDRTQGPAGEGVTGPAETGTAGGGKAGLDLSGPAFEVGSDGLPPEGASPSQPVRGELVTRGWGSLPNYRFGVNVYADGRVIWFREGFGSPPITPWIEQRLTPKGVALLQSGAVPLGGRDENPGEQLPATAWEDAEPQPYVPSEYAVCGFGTFEEAPPDAGLLLNLPREVAKRLQGTQHTFRELGRGEKECFEVSLEDARILARLLIVDQGWYHSRLGPWTWFANTPGLPSVYLEFNPVLPDGAIHTRSS